MATPEHPAEEEVTLRYTIYVDTYGHKAKQVRTVGHHLAKALHLLFGDKFKLVDHKSQPVPFDADAHDFGIGES